MEHYKHKNIEAIEPYPRWEDMRKDIEFQVTELNTLMARGMNLTKGYEQVEWLTELRLRVGLLLEVSFQSS